ncbi:thiol:disulfide interchange protein [Leucothrix pacifica]|uniref:Thiol:disulfide interchange protein DsbD n=2 Tax=Leucothrix pacifica TaxID=1247513 RepID=A0A317CKI1_9GAMM|nr:thiol:disulfide interchange protein [Leucothrix pacifica]
MRNIMKAFFSVIVLLITTSLYAASDTLLRPSEAFKLTTETIDSQTVRATWTIEEGYYLYRDKIDFISETQDSSVANVFKPAGNPKKDPTFGEVDIYRGVVTFDISLQHNNSNSPQLIQLLSKSQGCADIGLCYPPQKQTVNVKLPPSFSNTATSETPLNNPISPVSLADELGISSITGTSEPDSITGIGGISSIGGNQANEPLPPDEAFRFDIIATDSNTLNARWNVTPGHYLYQHKIGFKVDGNKHNVTLGKPNLPEGKAYKDVYFGDVVTYDKDFEVTVPVSGYNETLEVITEYQGCSELTGICYPPQTKTELVDFSAFPPSTITKAQTGSDASNTTDATTTEKTATPTADTTTITESASQQSALSDALKNKGILAVIGLFFLGGLLLTFTPCVFPMIPILSGIITGQGEDLSRGKAFALSLAYVVPMALTYAAAGVIAGYTGANLQAALQNPWVLSMFALLFVILSLSMFGFYELQMPSAIQNKLNNISNTQRGGSLVGAGIMGVLSALIVGPCVTAPLIAALAYIADTKDVVLGGLSLFMLGMGMGAPLLVIGVSAGSVLPRAGAWMETVKHIFGVMMLGLAIWMLDRIVPPQITLLLSGILLVGSAIFLGATDSLNETSSGWKRLWKSSGLVSLLLGTILIIGAAAGSKSYFAPLSGLLATNSPNNSSDTLAEPTGLQFKKISSLSDLDSTLQLARNTNTPVMLDFYAYWCLPCREMEHTVFSDSDVVATLENTIVIQADVTDMNENDSALLKELEVFGPPHVIFYDRNGEERKDFRISGEMKLEPFKQHIQRFLSNV